MKRSDLFFAFVLIPIDIAMVVAAFALSHYIRVDLEVIPVIYDIGLKEYLRYSLYLIPIWVLLFAVNGLYRIRSNQSFTRDLYRIIDASSIAILILIVAIFLSRSLFFSRLILILTWIISIAMIALGRLTVRLVQQYLFRYDIGIHRIALIGDNSASELLSRYLSDKKNMGYRVCGIITDEENSSKFGLKVIGSMDNLVQVINSYHLDEIVLTETNLKKAKIMDLIQVCSDRNIIFKYVPDVLALMTKNVFSGLIGSMPVMELQPIPLDGWGRIVKRFVDLIFSGVILVILSPLLILVSLLVKLTSKGPVIYKHKRVGRDGRSFDFYKFRSMYAEKCDYRDGGSKWTTKGDERTRITPLGLILRKTYLDELPQFVNVIKGDMSFVGPRPEQPAFVEQFQREIPEYFRRHRVKSGITGWAQVNGLKGDTSIKERVKFDTYYIENWSLLFDFVIILKTFKLVFSEALGGKTEYRSK